MITFVHALTSLIIFLILLPVNDFTPSPHPPFPPSPLIPPHTSCGVMLLGALGLPLSKLALLALDMAGYRVMKVDVSTQSGFRDAMQSLLRQAGLEKKQVAAVFTVSCTIASSMFTCCASVIP